MGFRSTIKNSLKRIVNWFGFDLVPQNLVYDWQQEGQRELQGEIYLPENALETLRADNPVLQSYQERYLGSDYPSGEVLLWTQDRVRPEDILLFRGHNAYLFQEGKFNRNYFGYLLAYYYTKSIDKLDLLEKLQEDSAFGVITYQIDGRQVSRDLLDSILEIYFLEKHLGIIQKNALRVLDIGAGYGRLAHRMVRSLPKLAFYGCTDAIAVSSFLADYYLKYRGIDDRARVIHLDTIRQELEPNSLDLAVNIHSFSECTLPAIAWWLDLLVDLRVPYLMIVPNHRTKLLTFESKDFQGLVEERGYELLAMEPKYLDPVVQRYALNPDYFHLFKLK